MVNFLRKLFDIAAIAVLAPLVIVFVLLPWLAYLDTGTPVDPSRRRALTGAVYDPPRPDLPHVAVLFNPDGQVLSARVVPSVEIGDHLIQSVLKECAEKEGIGAKVEVR